VLIRIIITTERAEVTAVGVTSTTLSSPEVEHNTIESCGGDPCAYSRYGDATGVLVCIDPSKSVDGDKCCMRRLRRLLHPHDVGRN